MKYTEEDDSDDDAREGGRVDGGEKEKARESVEGGKGGEEGEELRLRQLQELFEVLDSDGNGSLSR